MTTDPIADLRTLRDRYLELANHASELAAKGAPKSAAWRATVAYYEDKAAAVEVAIAARSGSPLVSAV